MTVYLLSGYKQSGKDTAANFLVEALDFKRRAFADSLKDDVAVFFNISRKDMDDNSKKESPILIRPVTAYDPFSKMVNEFLVKEFRTNLGEQAITYEWADNKLYAIDNDGMVTYASQLYWTPRAACIFVGSVGRSFNANHWVDRALNLTRTKDQVVVSDFRYKSEYDRVTALFGKEKVKTIRIDRYDNVNSTDPSERNLDDFEFDIRIENKGTLEDFLNKVKGAL
jgi:hypothetical protein